MAEQVAETRDFDEPAAARLTVLQGGIGCIIMDSPYAAKALTSRINFLERPMPVIDASTLRFDNYRGGFEPVEGVVSTVPAEMPAQQVAIHERQLGSAQHDLDQIVAKAIEAEY